MNPFFRVKVTLFLFVLVHAIVFRPRVYNKPELLDMAPQPPMRAKLAGGISLVLWLSIMIAGRGIGYINAPSGLHFAELLRKVAGAV